MKSSFRSLASLTLLLGAVAITSGCSDQLLGPEDAASTVAAPGDQGQAAPGADLRRGRIEVRLSATSADPRASGKAKFEVRDSRRRFSTEVEDVAVNGTGRVRVTRSGQTVLDAPIQISNGFGDLNLDTLDGQQVPGMRPGDVVRVTNANGQVILQGAFPQG